MKKKVLYGVALTLFASVSVGSLQSCKDDVNDLATQTSFNLANAQSQIDSIKTEVAKKLYSADLAAEVAKLDVIKDLLKDVEKLENKPSGSDYDDTTLRNDLTKQIKGAISQLNSDIQDQLSQLQQDLANGQDNLKEELLGKIKANEAAIAALDEYVKNLEASNQNEFNQIYQQLEEARQMISQVYTVLNDQITELDGKVDELIEAVNNSIKAIINQLDNQVTGILIQGVKSPVFGDFRLPIGVKSNVLFNWYGYNGQNMPIAFPSNEAAFSATGDPALNAAVTPKSTITVPEGYYDDVILGKVYVTLNPVGAKFNNLEVSIEPSAGEALPFKVELTPSDEVLYHGYSRSEENGFYEGVVKMEANEENINATRIEIEESLKSAMKDALKDPSKRTAVALLKGLYDQMSGMLPAYALRYDWTTGEVPSLEESMDPSYSVRSHAVLSQYDLAVATARPLSYNFLAGTSINKKLPTLSPIDNLILKLKEEGDFQFKFDPITFDDIEITLPPITISAKDVELGSTTVKADINPIEVKQGGVTIGVTEPSHVDVDINNVVGDIANQINQSINSIKSSVEGWSGSADADISNQLQTQLGKIADQINDMMNSINGQIDDMIDNLGNKFQGIFDKVNKAFELYNRVANKVNTILDDPNAYLQVTALYSINGGYGFVSGSREYPTTFVRAGGNAFNLYLTSYTGELIVPAYKKYVAITGVTKNGQPVATDLNALNSNSSDLNAVLDGSQIGVQVSAKGLEVGNVYEFTYQAIDYRGYTSTRKFYIEVK